MVRPTVILKTLFLMAMWGTCLYFIIKLSRDYEQSGSKPSTKTETVQVDVMDSPWLGLVGDVGNGCYYMVTDCVFSSMEKQNATSCDSAVKMDDEYVSMLNKTALRQLGLNFTNPYDFVVLSVTLMKKDGAGVPISISFGECGIDRDTMDDPMLIPVGDQTVIDAIESGRPIDHKRLGIPTFIGPGQKAQLTFSLNQEQYLNGTIRNTTEFGITQYPKHKLEYIEVHINPGTFAMQRVVHTKGQSLVNLMGSIFGWIGVLTGACMYSIFSYLVDFVEDHKKVTKQHLEALGQNSKTKPNLSEPTAAVHPLVDI
eukprot:TRINITY_DN3315_c0_g1_i2.p1 TRINITY_DN3315_c0_g1~~TRINITY_DN3315_c0_g1_i2.p1  ORF type:complete len:313 (+),score=59.87 TRINITY_DN3315_c0_g1_i2:67-1005(+)